MTALRSGVLAAGAVAGAVAAPALAAVVLSLVLAAVLDSRLATARCEVVVAPDSDAARRLAKCDALLAPYRSYPFFRNRHVATILPAMFRPKPAGITYSRECVQMRDGGYVTLDFLHSPEVDAHPRTAPVLLLLSGIAGGSGDAYVLQLVALAAARGFRPVAFNSRGCAGGPITVPRFYSASWTSDLREAVPRVASQFPGAPLLALGWSLGANILVNYVAEEGARCVLAGAASLCNPHDLAACDSALESTPIGRVYSKSMGNGLRRVFAPHAALFAKSEAPLNPSGAANAQSVREFDAALTAPTFGFATVDDYYAASGSGQKVHAVRVPLLCVAAADDPIAVDAAVPRSAVASNPIAALVVTPSGGHLGWVSSGQGGGLSGQPWPYEGVLQWLSLVVDEAREGGVNSNGAGARQPAGGERAMATAGGGGGGGDVPSNGAAGAQAELPRSHGRTAGYG